MKGIFKGLGVTLKAMTAKKSHHFLSRCTVRHAGSFSRNSTFRSGQMHRLQSMRTGLPNGMYYLNGKANPDPEKKGKVIDTYDINFEICILCDLCTEVCPTEAIVMTNNFELAAYSRDDLFKDMEWLDENNKNVRQDNNNIGAPAAQREEPNKLMFNVNCDRRVCRLLHFCRAYRLAERYL